MSIDHDEHYFNQQAIQDPPAHGSRVELRFLEPGQEFTLDRIFPVGEYRVVRHGYGQTICEPVAGGPETGLDSGREVSVR